MDFLYFPDDKMDYIPAFISLTIFMTGAVLAMYFFYKKSKKEEQDFNEKFEQIHQDHQSPDDDYDNQK